jgi:membrane protein implicated in regulation of membrane protease activity
MLLLEHTGRTVRWNGWLRTVLLSVAGIAILALAFFFLALAVVTGAVLASAIALRWWWVTRRLRHRQQAQRRSVLEGEYQVIERRNYHPDE